MPHAVTRLALLVRDYDEALDFFTRVLRFELVEDTAMGNGKRWVVVAPRSRTGAELLLARAVTAEQETRIGNQTGGRVFLFLHTDDFAGEYEHLKACGVRFVDAPREEPYGTVVVFFDLYGNKWDLIQPHAASADSAGAATDLERNKALVRALVAAVNTQDWTALDGVVAADFVRHSAAAGEPPVLSRNDLVGFLKGELATFPDAEEELLDLIAEGDRVAARQRFSGTQRGARMSATYLAIYRIADGRIAEAWAEWDNLTGLRQLGHLPS